MMNSSLGSLDYQDQRHSMDDGETWVTEEVTLKDIEINGTKSYGGYPIGILSISVLTRYGGQGKYNIRKRQP